MWARPVRHSEAMAMEVATAIILTQNAQEKFPSLGTDFAHQVDVMVARIHGCIAQNPPSPGSEIPALDEMSRRAQEKLLVAQVAKEIQYNLAQIEPVLDAFFRGDGRGDDINALDAPLHQVIGALSMMRYDGAVEALNQCAAAIKLFAAPDYVPQEADFEQVAEQLSVLGFYVTSLPHGSSDFASFVRGMQPTAEAERAREAQEKERAADPGAPTQGEAAGERGHPSPTSVEQEVEQQKREAHALLEAVKEQPNDQGLREELKQNLSALQKDADLVADKELVQQTKNVLSALEAGGDSSMHIDAALASLKPPRQEAPTPSVATVQLAQSSAEEIDAELLAIFLEEAREVIGEVDANLTLLAEQPHYNEALSHLRRSFHTRKGSGRMVGLRDLGEVAWAVEQVLNLWLRQELDVASPVLNMLELAHTVFLAWIEHLEGHSATPPDTVRLVALTRALRSGDDSAMEAALSGMSEAAIASPAPPVTDAPKAPEPEEPVHVHSAEIITLAFPARPAKTPVEAPPEPLPEAASADLLAPFDIPDFELTPANLPASPAAVTPDEAEASAARLADEAEAVAAEENRAETRLLRLPPEAEAPKAAPPQNQLRISVSAILSEIFLEEASGHLVTLQRTFNALELDPGEAQPFEMHRAAHTLGGIAGTVGLMPINQLGLALEHALLRRAAFVSSLPRTARQPGGGSKGGR